eukprot:scaffold10797_cov187-Amphora_coffeaeformis.AAC.1
MELEDSYPRDDPLPWQQETCEEVDGLVHSTLRFVLERPRLPSVKVPSRSSMQPPSASSRARDGEEI